MRQRETILVLDLGAPHVQACVETLEASGFFVEKADDFSALQRLSPGALILLPSCERASWVGEQISSHPQLSELPVIGFGETREEGLDDFLGWPLDESVLVQQLSRWLAEAQARQAQAEVGVLLTKVAQAGRVLADRTSLEQNLGGFMRLVADIFGVQASALLMLGKNGREAYITASTELGEGQLVPLDETAAVALKQRIEGNRALQVDEEEGDSLLSLALERDPAQGLEQSLSFPVPVGGGPAGALLVAQGDGPEPTELLMRAGELLAQLVGTALQGSSLLKRIREQTARVSLERVATELRTRSLRRYQEFFESSPDGVIVLDGEASVLHINQAGAMMTGYASGYLVGRPLAEIVAEHHRDGLVEIVLSAARDVPLRNFDLQLLTTSEDRITVAVSTSSLKLDKATTVFTFRDVTEAREIENELLNTKEFLEQLIASAVDAIVAADSTDGTIILFNQGAQNLFGRTAEDTVGKVRLDELFPEEEYEDLMRQLHSPHFGGEGRLEQCHKHARDSVGQHVPVSMTASIISDDMREVALVSIITDLREQIQMQERLAITQERLEVTEKQALIAELAGTTAHELNQPLTSVMGYAELLLKKMGTDSPFSGSVSVIMQEAERLAEIVRKIGKITRYETKSYVGGTQILDLDRATEE
jgi:PAS domain S-box-containing protein